LNKVSRAYRGQAKGAAAQPEALPARRAWPRPARRPVYSNMAHDQSVAADCHIVNT